MIYQLHEVMPTAQHDIRQLLAAVGPRDYAHQVERKASCTGGSLWRIVASDAPAVDPRSGASACWYRSPEKARESWERRVQQAFVWGLAPIASLEVACG